MIYLLLSILCSTSLVIILRLFSNWNIKTPHGIVFNYLVCCITGLLFIGTIAYRKRIFQLERLVCLLTAGNLILHGIQYYRKSYRYSGRCHHQFIV